MVLSTLALIAVAGTHCRETFDQMPKITSLYMHLCNWCSKRTMKYIVFHQIHGDDVYQFKYTKDEMCHLAQKSPNGITKIKIHIMIIIRNEDVAIMLQVHHVPFHLHKKNCWHTMRITTVSAIIQFLPWCCQIQRCCLRNPKCVLCYTWCALQVTTVEIGQTQIGEVEFDSLAVRLALRRKDQQTQHS